MQPPTPVRIEYGPTFSDIFYLSIRPNIIVASRKVRWSASRRGIAERTWPK